MGAEGKARLDIFSDVTSSEWSSLREAANEDPVLEAAMRVVHNKVLAWRRDALDRESEKIHAQEIQREQADTLKQQLDDAAKKMVDFDGAFEIFAKFLLQPGCQFKLKNPRARDPYNHELTVMADWYRHSSGKGWSVEVDLPAGTVDIQRDTQDA